MTGITCWNFAHSGHPEGNPRWGDQFRPRDLFHLPPDDHGAGGAFGTALRWRVACDLGHTFKSFKGQRVGNSLGLTYVFHCVPLCSHVSLPSFHTFYGIEDWSIIPALYSLRHTGITFGMCFSSPSWALWAHNEVITDRKDGKIRLTMMAPVTFVLILVMCLCLGGDWGRWNRQRTAHIFLPHNLHQFLCSI